MSNSMIDVKQLTKRFGRLKAVDDVSFEVQPGQSIALWGANGAGKTTVLRCLLNLLPFEGQISVAGHDVCTAGKKARQHIGFVPQTLSFHDDMRVDETLVFYGRLKKVDFDDTTAVEELLKRLQLETQLAKRVGDCSGGQKQRLALALALLADPPLLLLDEPTASLDVGAREDFISLLLDLRRVGKTIVFSTHRLEEMSALADRVVHLVDGRLEADEPPAELRRKLGWTTLLHVTLPAEAIDMALKILDQHGLTGRRNGRGIFVPVPAGEKARPLQLLYREGIEVVDFAVDSP